MLKSYMNRNKACVILLNKQQGNKLRNVIFLIWTLASNSSLVIKFMFLFQFDSSIGAQGISCKLSYRDIIIDSINVWPTYDESIETSKYLL